MKNTLITIEEAENGFVVEINPYANNRRRAIFSMYQLDELLKWIASEIAKECFNKP